MNSSLNAARRTRELEALRDDPNIDLLVIGGGVTGAGIALDAAARGLRTVLVEKHDLAFGTSRWSSKLVHGGLRYLASGRVGIAHESAYERAALIRYIAPHLVRPLPQLVPIEPNIGRFQRALVRFGFIAGDALRISARTPRSILPRSRKVSAAEALRSAPTLRREGLKGGIVAWDGQLVDDARLVVAIARTAAQHGASILTRVEALNATGTSATLKDTLTRAELVINAKAVVNAAGVWAGHVDPAIRLRPSRGTHLVFSQESFGGLAVSLTVPVPGSTSRFVFAFPAAHGRVYLGLTDEDSPGPVPDVPHATDGEIDFLLATVNQVLAKPLTRADVLGTYAGLRPLLDTGDGETSDLSRNHAVMTAENGLISIVGGKLTTYRKMAEDAVDAAIEAGQMAAGPCRTLRLPLVGAVSGAERDAIKAPLRLIERYGTEAPDVVAAGVDELVAPGLDVRRYEFDFAVQHEGALTVDDLLDRRTRIGLVAGDRANAMAAAEAAIAMAANSPA